MTALNPLKKKSRYFYKGPVIRSHYCTRAKKQKLIEIFFRNKITQAEGI